MFSSIISPTTAVPHITRRQRVLCVAATLVNMPSEDLAAVASEMEGCTRAGTIGLSGSPGVRALIQTMVSVDSGES